MIKTNKTGIYYNELENGDKAFYFNYKDINDNRVKIFYNKKGME